MPSTQSTSLLDSNHFGAAELTLSRLGKDRGWAPEKQGSASVAVHFEVVHIVPEALEAEYWEAQGLEGTVPALPQHGTSTLCDSDPASASVSADAPGDGLAPDATD